jgi:deoxyribonuclease-4
MIDRVYKLHPSAYYGGDQLILDRVRFGPAGFPIDSPKERAFEYLRKIGLSGMEYQAVRRVPTNEKELKKLGEEAKENDILLTLHAPYAINLSAETEEKIKGSINRLLSAAKAAKAMGALHVTFHPGYYLKRSRNDALRVAISALRELREIMTSEGIDVELGPETMGKPSQLGSLDDVLEMAKSVEGVSPTIDFAHLHVRDGGIIKGEDDYRSILRRIEREIGDLNGLVVHFTEVEATSSGYGERMHHELGSGYGPDFHPLAKIIAENGLKWFIVSESPILERDSVKMKEIYESFLRGS